MRPNRKRIDGLKIGGQRIPVVYTKLSADTFGEFRQTPDPGIMVQDGMSEPTTMATLLHEAIHAYDFHMAMGLKEDQVRRLDFAISTLLRDNPEFVRRLVGTRL